MVRMKSVVLRIQKFVVAPAVTLLLFLIKEKDSERDPRPCINLVNKPKNNTRFSFYSDEWSKRGNVSQCQLWASHPVSELSLLRQNTCFFLPSFTVNPFTSLFYTLAWYCSNNKKSRKWFDVVSLLAFWGFISFPFDKVIIMSTIRNNAVESMISYV